MFLLQIRSILSRVGVIVLVWIFYFFYSPSQLGEIIVCWRRILFRLKDEIRQLNIELKKMYITPNDQDKTKIEKWDGRSEQFSSLFWNEFFMGSKLCSLGSKCSNMIIIFWSVVLTS